MQQQKTISNVCHSWHWFLYYIVVHTPVSKYQNVYLKYHEVSAAINWKYISRKKYCCRNEKIRNVVARCTFTFTVFSFLYFYGSFLNQRLPCCDCSIIYFCIAVIRKTTFKLKKQKIRYVFINIYAPLKANLECNKSAQRRWKLVNVQNKLIVIPKFGRNKNYKVEASCIHVFTISR